MNIDILFPTNEDKATAKEALYLLAQNQGWKILMKVIDKDLERLDNELKFAEFENLEEQKLCQKRYADLVLLKEYPSRIIAELADGNVPELELDPYSFSEPSVQGKGKGRN